MFCKIKTELLLIPAKKTPNLIWTVNSSIDCSIVRMTSKRNFPESSIERCCLHPSSLSQWKFALICFCSISQLNVLHFCLRPIFTFIFQSHVKVALNICDEWSRILIHFIKRFKYIATSKPTSQSSRLWRHQDPKTWHRPATSSDSKNIKWRLWVVLNQSQS